MSGAELFGRNLMLAGALAVAVDAGMFAGCAVADGTSSQRNRRSFVHRETAMQYALSRGATVSEALRAGREAAALIYGDD